MSNQIPNQLVGIKYQIKYFDVSEMISQTKFMIKYSPKSKIIGIQILSFKALNGPKQGCFWLFYKKLSHLTHFADVQTQSLKFCRPYLLSIRTDSGQKWFGHSQWTNLIHRLPENSLKVSAVMQSCGLTNDPVNLNSS